MRVNLIESQSGMKLGTRTPYLLSIVSIRHNKMLLIRIDIVSGRMTHVWRRTVKYKMIKDKMNERINEPSTIIY